MPKFNTEFFIARRLSGRRSSGQRNVMVRIATLTVAISIMVMIISLAVITGFKRGITDKVVGFGAHVQIVNLDGNTSLETTPIRRNNELEKQLGSVKDLRQWNVYAVKGGILKTDDAMQGIMLKGVDADYDWSFFESVMVEGELPSVGDSVRTKDIIVSQALATLMKIGIDDRIEMLFVQANQPPRRDRFKITGIYSTGFEELDMMVIPTDIRNVQRLGGWDEDQITGYELTTTDFSDLDEFRDRVFDIVLAYEGPMQASLMVTDITERFVNLFDWLKAHNVNAAVIIIIMLLVALLNMISALLIIVLERTRMIGELKALGMSNPSLQKVFLIRSGYIILKGMIWGNLIGIGLCLLQQYTGLVKLDEAGYFLAEVPIRLGVAWLIALNIGSFALILSLLTIPTNIVSRIKPETTIRFQ